MTDYELRKAERVARYRELAEKNKKTAEERFERAHVVGSRIPFGQPILVGHHSEKGHRADIRRIDSHMQKGSEAMDKAKYYAERAISAENNNNIYIEDPEALQKTEERLAAYKAQREAYKSFNKTWRQEGLVAAVKAWPGSKERILDIINCYCQKYDHEKQERVFHDTKGLPGYILTNLGARIRALEQKLKQIEQVEAMPEGVLFESAGVRVEFLERRINVVFEAIPGPEVRDKLKRSPLALKWSPSRGAWTRAVGATTHVGYLIEEIKKVVANEDK